MPEPPNPPDPLLAACAAFQAAFERERRARPATDRQSDRLGHATDRAFVQIVGRTPTTPAALAAKASAALTRLLWQVAPGTRMPWRQQTSPAEQAALECLAVVSGRTLP